MPGEYQPPDKGFIELQQELLKGLQREISERLFVSGAVSRILEASKPDRPQLDTTGAAQFGYIYTPSTGGPRVDGSYEKILNLAIIEEGPNTRKTFDYVKVGEIDEAGFMHVMGDIPDDDADALLAEAKELEKLRTGDENNPPTLPNLSTGLVTINNPHQAMYRPDGK